MPIQIQSTRAQLSVQTVNASLEMQGNGGQVLALDTERGSLEMESTSPEIEIDQTACFAECGLKNIKDFMADSVAYGQQKFQEGVARIVEDGNQMASIENKADPIPDQAIQNAYTMFEHEFNYDAIPKSRPSITLKEGDVNYQYQPARVNNRTVSRKVENNFTPGKVEIAVAEYGKVTISYDSSSLSYHI
ncbi:hypothetical protein KHM83_03770 [Fusibacter paucivorans]|uniref:Uncharacterized protein n=1 Tax=Fusibacter paucivorans TaxID=76009 RepID=A0ABS5PL68_9FIRM|nr:DUF6470 family protein [Fusibacter paucivorans]MBS7525791.1 hypothetical protein [Fusibacter paucivorans]